MSIWECKIGDVAPEELPDGADWPLRQAVQKAFRELVGRDEDFCFSGWGGKLTEPQEEILRSAKKRYSDPAGDASATA